MAASVTANRVDIDKIIEEAKKEDSDNEGKEDN